MFVFACATNDENLLAGIVKRTKWLGRPVNIKEANKQAEIYVGRPLTPHIFCFMLIDYA